MKHGRVTFHLHLVGRKTRGGETTSSTSLPDQLPAADTVVGDHFFSDAGHVRHSWRGDGGESLGGLG